MEIKTISQKTQGILNAYLHLPVGDGAAVPYYNNRKRNAHGALRVLAGKGSPEEIREEVSLLRIKWKSETPSTQKEIRKLMLDHHIGIDCSGFVYHALQGELEARGIKKPLHRFLSYKNLKLRFMTKLVFPFRKIENTNVLVLADEGSSREVDLKNVLPGDFISMINADSGRNHIVLIHKIETENGEPRRIHYIHSIAWPSDGIDGHGVREAYIDIPQGATKITDGTWYEQDKTGQENYTGTCAKESTTTIRRLRVFEDKPFLE